MGKSPKTRQHLLGAAEKMQTDVGWVLSNSVKNENYGRVRPGSKDIYI